MCDTCPTNNTIGLEFAQGGCGQCWLRGDGSWRAVPQFVYREACKKIAELKYQKRVDLLGPNNVMPTTTSVKDLAWLGANNFCPWQNDWPKEAVWYYANTPHDINSVDLKWQSPFADQVLGVSKKWVLATVPISSEKWKAAARNGTAQYLQDLDGLG